MNFTRFCFGLVLIAIAAICLSLAVNPLAGYLMGTLGVLSYMILVMAWEAIIGSKSLWPNATSWQRFTYIATFKREEKS